MDNLINSSRNRDRRDLLLEFLAASLNCSKDDFFNPAPGELSDTLELLNLWFGTEDKQARARALTMLRSAMTKAQGKPVSLVRTVQQSECV